ncbi:mitogen-activated protein kinase binding protein 1 [Mortierella alpina]|nr:mitogen-activated protein kinase binding protein 1 [Mortierella alpina]
MLRHARRTPSNSNSNIITYASQGPPPASPAMRRKRKDPGGMLKLERVLGLTSSRPMVLSVNPTHDLVAYAAGCVVVLYNHKLDKQVGLLCSAVLNTAPSASAEGPAASSGLLGPGSRAPASLGTSPRTVGSQWTNNAFASPNINPLAGLMPMNISDPSVASSFGISNPSSNKNVKPKPVSSLSFSSDGQYLAVGETGHQPRILIWEVATQALVGELQGHKFGVQAVQFSPNSKYLVSLGFQHDGYLHVWHWRTGAQIASNRVTTKVNALTFSADGTFFVTAGLRHIKFWYLNVGASRKGGASVASSVQVLDGRAGILGELRDSNYVDAACSEDGRFTYAVTSTGILCLFSEGRIMEKWIDLHARGAYSVNLDDRCVICACTDGIIRLFEPESLQYIGTLAKPLPVGAYRGSMHESATEGNATAPVYADVLASQYEASSESLICIYSDRSLAVWDISNLSDAKLSRSHTFHTDCVWGVEVVPTVEGNESVHPFPPDTFVTYSADGSIKFWNLDENMGMLAPLSDSYESHTPEDSQFPRPSKEILSVLYVDENTKSWIQVPESQDGLDPGFNTVPMECGVRTVKISADGRFLASGDKGGNLRVHALSTLEKLTYQEAHDTEILAIDFTDPVNDEVPLLVATAGRDRLLHVFDVMNDFALVQTLDDHSSSITCIQFTADGSRMMSCGADKSIIFRNCHKVEGGIAYQPYHQAPGRATFYDMVLHHPSQTMAVVSGDRRFNVFALDSGKAIKSFKAETKGEDLTAGMAEVCSMTHVSLDPSGTIAAASGSDKSIRIYDLLHGTCLAHMICHSELVTGVQFISECNRIVSTSADGCVLIWRLSKDIVRRIHARVQESVTVPSYIQLKSTEILSSPNLRAIGASSRPMRIKKSTDKLTERLASYASETSGTSRRNSTTSMMSDDFDLRSEDNTDNWNERQQADANESCLEGASQHSFTPVTVEKSARTTGTRSRMPSGTPKTPVSRSRQSTVSQPAAVKSQRSSSRSGAHQPELPPWNRHVVKKERIPESPASSTRSSRPPSPRQRSTKTVIKGKWLATTTARPRATSLTVPNERVLQPNHDKANARTTDTDRHSLSDNAPSGKPSALAEDDEQEDELSEETESGFEDGPEFALRSSQQPSRSLKDARDTTSCLSSGAQHADDNTSGPHSRARTTDDALLSRAIDGEQYEQNQVDIEDEEDPNEGDLARDGDDEEGEEEESISEAGSEPECNSPLQRHDCLSADKGLPYSGGTLGKSASFQEGELLLSPIEGGVSQSASPTARVTSMMLSSSQGRRSLSAKFLTAHAAAVMLGLTQRAMQESPPASASATDSVESLPLEIESACVTPKAHYPSRGSKVETGPGNNDERQSSHTGSSGDTSWNETSLSRAVSGEEISLEERLNPRLLNMVAMKRKQRNLGSIPLGQRLSHDTFSQDVPSRECGEPVEHEAQSIQGRGGVSGLSVSDDYANEVARTRKRLVELGYLTSPGGSQRAPLSGDASNMGDSGLLKDGQASTPSSPQHRRGREQSQGSEFTQGVLASPATVDSPSSSHLTTGEMARSDCSFSDDGQANVSSNLDISTAAISTGSNLSMQTDRVGSFGEESLQDALEMIKNMIARKVQEANCSAAAINDKDTAEQTTKTTEWLKEAREGLLRLVGETQGQLWVLENKSTTTNGAFSQSCNPEP